MTSQGTHQDINVPFLDGVTVNGLDVTKPHPARRYNYWLGGKDNFGADRASGDDIEKDYPHVRAEAQQNRRWMHRVVRRLAGEERIEQFIDIGVGLPLAPNMHETAQRVIPQARIVYADNDPLVIRHAQALLTSDPPGVTDYAEVDVREPGKVLAAARGILDFRRPIAVLLVAVLHFIADDEQNRHIVAELLGGLPTGSLLAISHLTTDGMDETTREKVMARAAAGNDGTFRPRTVAEVESLFTASGRLSFLEPGLVPVTQWRPEPDDDTGPINVHGAVARKVR